MNKLNILFFLIISHLLACCNNSKIITDHPLVGTKQTLKIDCLAFEFNKASKKIYGVDYNLIEKGPNNDWRETGWIQAGGEIEITKVAKLSDQRGKFIAVFGTAPLPDGKPGKLTFIYYWSTGLLLNRAPWEDSSVKVKRKTDLLP